MIRRPPGYWTFERCVEEASKYERRKDFELGCNAARKAAMKNGWMDAICAHMTRGRNVHGHWTFERCAEEARLFETRYEFQKSSEAAYSAARKNGWLDQICNHMVSGCENRSQWSKRACEIEGLKYDTRASFWENSRRAATVASQNGWLDDICWFMDKPARDGLYIIREDLPAGFDYLVKFGHTTYSRGDARIKQGERHFESPVLVTYVQSNAAKMIERKLLTTFHRRPASVNTSIDGHTELRLLTGNEIAKALSLVRSD